MTDTRGMTLVLLHNTVCSTILIGVLPMTCIRKKKDQGSFKSPIVSEVEQPQGAASSPAKGQSEVDVELNLDAVGPDEPEPAVNATKGENKAIKDGKGNAKESNSSAKNIEDGRKNKQKDIVENTQNSKESNDDNHKEVVVMSDSKRHDSDLAETQGSELESEVQMPEPAKPSTAVVDATQQSLKE
ncbi:hypothetical protein AB6A40_005944 [Gnathostoma spinigerum]|uniref:Uncharacterized protein n=1 Tax=Gnathostoma spinigerum TaxID=75299 RepID=A0ABD6EGW6_9BILA